MEALGWNHITLKFVPLVYNVTVVLQVALQLTQAAQVVLQVALVYNVTLLGSPDGVATRRCCI